MAGGLVGGADPVRRSAFTAAPAGLACIAGATPPGSLGSVLSTEGFPLAAGPAGFASEMLCGGAVLMLFSLAPGEHAQAIVNWPFQPSAVLAWISLLVFRSPILRSACLYLLPTRRRRWTPARPCEPLIALFLGAFFAGEHATGAEWLASGVILVGVFTDFQR